MKHRLWALLFDLGFASLAYVLAWTWRFGADLPVFLPYARRMLPMIVAAQLAGALVAGGYRPLSRTTVIRFIAGVAAGAACGMVAAQLTYGPEGVSRSALAGSALLLMAAGGGWRAAGAIATRTPSANPVA